MPVPKQTPIRGTVRPVLFAIGAAVMIAAAELGRLLDRTRPPVDGRCPGCPHRSPRSIP